MAVDLPSLITPILTFFGIYWILAISYNLEYGYAGQPNFGKVLFYSVGAYAAGNVTARVLTSIVGLGGFDFCSAAAAKLRTDLALSQPPLMIGLFLASLVFAAALAGFLGFAVSFPALRLSGDFLAIVLVAVGEVGRVVARTYDPITCSVYGLDGIGNPFIWLRDPMAVQVAYACLVLAIAFAMHVYAQRLVNSPYGRLLKSVRDDELVAKVLGKKAPRVKGEILAIGSAMAGVAGALYAFFAQAVFADDYVPMLTFTVVVMVILGGVANNYGAAVGAMVVTLLDRLTRASFLNILGIAVTFDITYFRYILTGILMILILMFKPEGLVPEGPVKTPALKLAKEGLSRPVPTGD